MSILVQEFRGLDSGAAKLRRRQATSVLEGPSSKRRRPTSRREAKTVDLVSETESIKDGPSKFLHPPTPVRAVLSRVQNKIGNIHASISHLTTRLTSEMKDLQGTAETGFANVTSSIDNLTDAVTSGFRDVVRELCALCCFSDVAPGVSSMSAAAPSVMVPSVVVPHVPAAPERHSTLAGSPPSRPRLGRPRGTPYRR
ncbi:hypothetical protein CPC735_045810 [Coccidioides posadasii C735 delta SOWgp]|uniref:Uncharacterized protein n=3 Tax=Coccidioides posadasii TaxID=199306 RepID=E9DA02_COCPS|nr:hypothetical protein CPC735_045810 [Coccidioides posadasii C735 delta SOWgp]EER23211.1 hypothetical protein CPC735_045810 [Coccidioides posadasii C735 delta SOWgp]EFW16733.1 conserved hypothetical protein [Coccidioides posadasii str. Silveira]KMM64505.1 hypothetical protein CPAG_00857 [Coccidioides posadasii RMSCC 3488]|eukprot:XP_003065356.1 hypothetical protein CPC735_045810 [Coccidioides posadasii C735 delta SOWgp]